MVFDSNDIIATRIKEDADYAGVRIRFCAFLGRSEIKMQIDVGFGDVVTPEAQVIAYPTLIDMPQPHLTGYPRETVIAEKFQAMVYLGTLNSRMKDFFDIWLLARQFDFDGPTLTRAMSATFSNRRTAMNASPVALTAVFTESDAPSKQWTAFRRKAQLD
jgi:Nucleotidyl transferase AbiEii toxin, Type IV TA system